IANKVVPLNGTTSREIDFIVIGDRLVFVIDEKSWHGRIHGTDYEWVRDDGSAERSPLGKIDWVAKAIRGHLNRKVVGFDAVTAQCVVGCVLLSRATERPVLQDPRAKQGVVLLKDAVDHLTARDAAEGDPWISEIRRNIRSTFVNMQYRPKIPTRIGDYTIVEEIPAPGDGRRFRATHADGEPRELAMYPDPKDPIKRDYYGSEQRLYKRSQLTGLVPRVYDHIRWSDDQLVFVFAPPAGLSLPARPRPGNHQAVIEEIALARAAFASLAIVHGAGVTHRALSPANVFDNGPDASPRVAFAGFFAARQEDGKRTIQAELDDLHLDDVYAAPEIQAMGYGFADQATDVYSLALIFLERWSGTSIDDLHRDGHGAIQIPEPGDGWPYVPDPLLTDLTRFFRQAINTGSLVSGDGGVVARPTALECESELAKVLDRAVPRPVPMTGDTLADGRYEILRVLGTGATARTFLARDLVADGLFTLKQFLRPEIMAANGRISGEFNALRMSDHPRIPRVFEIYPANGDVHLKLDYIAGDKLGEVIGRYRHDVAACHALAQDVLGAIAHLESLELLHRDVKPDNIVIQNGTGFAYLIDFGATTTLARRTAAAGTPIYAPPESWLASEPPRSADRYAAAAVLFEALTGRLPWLQNQSLFDRQVMTDDEIGDLPAEARRYATVLLRVLHPDPARRHGSAAELSADLDQARRAAIEPSPGRSRGEEKINPTVGSIRGLFRNSTGGNADNRGLDTEFAFSTYVETALDTRLLPEILARRPSAVFLSGNPGDGKTAFLGRVERALGDRGGTRVTTDPSGWEWSMDGHAFRACYDASESHDGRSADEQLRGRLGGLEGDGLPNAHPTVLVAINDGRLAEFVAHHRETHGWLTRQIEVASRPDQPRQDGDVWVVDLKRRAFVSLHEGGPGTASVMRRILAELVAPDRWRACEGCVAAAVCPIRRNALVLDAAPGRPTANRLEHLLRLSHLRGQRHLTVRDLRSGLAYLI
ncbi:MAG: NERD domain-containing protein, partial [Chloroflexota bacterium]|nr:NERD domain-containing protein [Chloroflexota bacterium]